MADDALFGEPRHAGNRDRQPEKQCGAGGVLRMTMTKLETVFASAMLTAAKIKRAKLRATARALREMETKMIAEAVRDHVALPEHYWLERQQAEERVRTAERLVEALRL